MICANCYKEFEPKINRENRIFCSKKCNSQGYKISIESVMFYCACGNEAGLFCPVCNTPACLDCMVSKH